jgi:hypothetical protein
MMRGVAVSAGALAVVGCVLLSATALRSESALRALARFGRGADFVDNRPRIVPPSAVSSSPAGEPGDDSSGTGKTDLEGDEVSPALATYGIDRDGNLFEVHSPHTEVPRLPGPTI